MFRLAKLRIEQSIKNDLLVFIPWTIWKIVRRINLWQNNAGLLQCHRIWDSYSFATGSMLYVKVYVKVYANSLILLTRFHEHRNSIMDIEECSHCNRAARKMARPVDPNPPGQPRQCRWEIGQLTYPYAIRKRADISSDTSSLAFSAMLINKQLSTAAELKMAAAAGSWIEGLKLLLAFSILSPVFGHIILRPSI